MLAGTRPQEVLDISQQMPIFVIRHHQSLSRGTLVTHSKYNHHGEILDIVQQTPMLSFECHQSLSRGTLVTH